MRRRGWGRWPEHEGSAECEDSVTEKLAGNATIRLLVDGTPLERGTAATINVGMVSPTPHLYSSYVPADIYRKILDGKALLAVQTSITYRGPDGRQFCYHESNTYDNRANAFGPSGGSDKCGDATY